MIQLNSSQQIFYDNDSKVKIWASSSPKVGQTFLAAYSALSLPGNWVVVSRSHKQTATALAGIYKEFYPIFHQEVYCNYTVLVLFKEGKKKTIGISSFKLLETTDIQEVNNHFIIDDFEKRGDFDVMNVRRLLGDHKLHIYSKAHKTSFKKGSSFQHASS